MDHVLIFTKKEKKRGSNSRVHMMASGFHVFGRYISGLEYIGIGIGLGYAVYITPLRC